MKRQDRRGITSTDQPPAPDPCEVRPDVVVEHDFDDPAAELTVTVVDAVSEAAGVSPTEVVPCVNDHVDPDALDRLFRPRPDGTPRQGRLTIELMGCRVDIVSDGTVLVYDS